MKLCSIFRMCLQVLLALSVCSSELRAKAGHKTLKFGRYSETYGFDNPICRAVGAQIQSYGFVQRAPTKLEHNIKQIELGDMGQDARHNFPLRTAGKLVVPKWHRVDSISSYQNFDLLKQLYVDFSNQSSNWKVGVTSADSERFARGQFIRALNEPLEIFLELGIIRLYVSTIGLGENQNAQVYAISAPLDQKNQQFRFAAFDEHSPLYKTRWTAPLNNLFSYDGEGFFLIADAFEKSAFARGGESPVISIVPIERVIKSDESVLRSGSKEYLANPTCLFLLDDH